MDSEPVLRLTAITGRSVRSPDGSGWGVVRDLTVRLGADHPRVEQVLVVRRGTRRLVPWSAVLLDGTDVVLLVEPDGGAGRRDELDLEADELLLVRDVLDCQIVDLAGRRLTRASDVVLSSTPEGDLVLVGVEVGGGAVLRRLGLGWLAGRLRHQVLPIDRIHLSSARGHQVQLAQSTSAVHQLDGAGLSQLLTHLDVTKATEVLSSVGPVRAAAALFHAHPEIGGRLMSGAAEPRVLAGPPPSPARFDPDPPAPARGGAVAPAPVEAARWLADAPSPWGVPVTAPPTTGAHRGRSASRWGRLAVAASVLGPGLLAGLSDDDPAGITTYSVLGAEYGYQLLWVLLLSTVALVVFHNLGARMGVVTGQGLIGLVRQRFGVRAAAAALAALLVANLGTTCAEYAGVAAGLELFGVARGISVPVAAGVVTVLVLRGSFHRVEHMLMALSAVFLAYIVAGVVARPDWGAAARGLVVPSMPLDRDAVLTATATLGTTLAPWGLSFIQSYAVDKRLRVEDLRWERVDVVVGAVLTGVIGLFVVIACASTLHVQGVTIEDAADAAQALAPLAGGLSATLFGIGLVGAALLAASVLPLSTAYSVCEFTGSSGAGDATASAGCCWVTSRAAAIGPSSAGRWVGQPTPATTSRPLSASGSNQLQDSR